jgi:hypothetical protein
MGYSLGFWAAPLDTLVEELTQSGAGDPPEKVYQRARAVLIKIGRHFDSVMHRSRGGTLFRKKFVGRTLAGLIGADAAGFLLDRELAGTRWNGYPSMGWLTGAELAEVIAKLNKAGDEALTGLDYEDAAEYLEEFVELLHAVAATGQDLVTTYT